VRTEIVIYVVCPDSRNDGRETVEVAESQICRRENMSFIPSCSSAAGISSPAPGMYPIARFEATLMSKISILD